MHVIKIGIVDDHSILRTGLRQYFAEQTDMQVVGEATNGRDAIDLVRNTEMDVLLMDISMPGQSGMDALSMIRAKAPDLGILILTMHPEDPFAPSLMKQGASGFLNKECDPEEILQAIRSIAAGNRYLSRAVAEVLAQSLADNGQTPMRPHDRLTEREFQVLVKLAEGRTSGEIANALSLSPKTISTYRSRIMEKLELETNSELTYYAVKHQLIS